ncbi:uncharacterized protein IL334_006982 [Kwoniella shivajii]|uniref:alpha-1,6-mannosyl-glycoprotein 6-beta-N-acetylglucosaminyltransferase n=1 Tax=Kwoniella shivajii TaxID=564305 RepID=A0ABZ1D988_9TREE|nr:hypothetical protein IL334_006982 [Kwoniella shivajii]
MASPRPVRLSKIGSRNADPNRSGSGSGSGSTRSHKRSVSTPKAPADPSDTRDHIPSSSTYRRDPQTFQESDDEFVSEKIAPIPSINPSFKRPNINTLNNTPSQSKIRKTKSWSPPNFGLRRILFFALISATLLVMFFRPSISDIFSTTIWLPSSWRANRVPVSSDISTLSPKERKLAVKQIEYAHNMENYFPSERNWGGREHGREDYKFHTEKELRKLAVCTATNTCRENQTNVVILGHIFSHFHIYEGYMGGEGIWTANLVETLTKWGYTILHARDDWVYMWYIYNQIPDMVKAIVAWRTGQYGTFEDHVKSPWRINGVPAWKFFVYNYFPDHYTSIVGDAWNMHSEFGFSHKQRNFTFIPYVVEPATTPPYTPSAQRPNQVYILAKFLRYFYPGAQPAWEDTGVFLRAKTVLEQEFPGFEFVVGCKDDRNSASQIENSMQLPDGIRNLGQMDRIEFEHQLANSRVMLGIGWPTLSPSPHVALSLGIPFINPYSMWGWSSFDDPDTWQQSQHHTLKALGEPYIYHVLRNNETELIEAIRKALSTPIEPYILPIMTRDYHERQVSKWINTDWKSKAERILENRKKGIETENGNDLKEFML